MRIVGITGSFGSGKSFVASVFKKLGAKVLDADKLGHKSLERGSTGYRRVVSVFGAGILKPDLSVNKRALADIVFSDKKKLAKLNNVVHPGIIREISRQIKSARRGKGIFVLDAPLICESNITNLIDDLIVVKASKADQIKRSCRKFGLNRGDVCKRISRQMPLSKKIRMADYIVDNRGTKKETQKQVREIWLELKKEE